MKSLMVLALFLTVGCASQSESAVMSSEKDEQAIRQWFADWLRASEEGQLELAKSLIDDDAVFLIPGGMRMGKDTYAAAATATSPNVDFELDCEVEDVRVIGDYAWLLGRLGLSMTNKQTGVTSKMVGHSLSMLKRNGDGWVVIRDANTMIPSQG